MKRFNRCLVFGVALLGCFGLQAQLTPDQEKKALEILRSIEVARPMPGANVSPKKPSEAAIQEAYSEANRAARVRPTATTPVSQETLSQEMALVEAEIVKARQDSGEPLAASIGDRHAVPQKSNDDVPPPPAFKSMVPMNAEQEAKAVDLLRAVSREIMNESTPVVAKKSKAAPIEIKSTSVNRRSAPPEKVLVVEIPQEKTAPPAPSSPKSAPGLSPREQALADLLNAYKNEEISASKYHQERSRILGQP